MSNWLGRLHPYDGVERRFQHTDANPSNGLNIVTELLQLEAQPSAIGLYYDLSFYSGGIGVIDRTAISLPANEKVWSDALTAISGKTPEEMAADSESGEAFRHLVNDEEASFQVASAAVCFVNSERAAFQSMYSPGDRLFFGDESNVNYWVVVWGNAVRLNYLGYDQG